jgi:hypothetical protein
VNIAFPILDDDEHHLSNHPSIKTLREKLNLDSLCGYITLLQLKKPKTFEAGENLTEDSLLAPTECDADRVSVTSFRATLSSTVTKDPRYKFLGNVDSLFTFVGKSNQTKRSWQTMKNSKTL